MAVEPVLTMITSLWLQRAVEAIRTALSIQMNPNAAVEITLPSGQHVTLEPADAQRLRDELRSDTSNSVPAQPSVADGLPLADVDDYFQKAKGRIDFVFKIELAVALLIAAVLVSTLVGIVISLAIGSTALVAGLGVTAVADLIGAGIYKPLDKVSQALVDTQRLDAIHMSAKTQLATVKDDDENKLSAYRAIWTDILEQLRTWEGKPPPST